MTHLLNDFKFNLGLYHVKFYSESRDRSNSLYTFESANIKINIFLEQK